MSIATANEDIRARVEAAFEESLRRYAFVRYLAATDDCLCLLEDLNLRGVPVVSSTMRRRINGLLEELPEAYRDALSQDTRTQRVLESIYVIQDRLLNRKHPERRELLALEEEDDG